MTGLNLILNIRQILKWKLPEKPQPPGTNLPVSLKRRHPFIARNVKIDDPGNLFTPLSKLNSFRREFIEKAESELLNADKPSIESIEAAGNHLANVKNQFKTTVSKSRY